MYYLKETLFAGGKVMITLEACSDRSDDAEADKDISLSVGKEFFVPFGLKEGDTVDNSTADALSEAAQLTEAVSRALDVLSYSNHSRKSLVMKLKTKYHIDGELSDAAADYCVGHGYIDELYQCEKYAKAAVRSKKWGKRRIVSELTAKGYPSDVALKGASSVGESEYFEALENLIERKMTEYPSDRKELSHSVASFVRLGHSVSDIQRAMKKIFPR